MTNSIFAAYPSAPTVIGDCICAAVPKLATRNVTFHPWEHNDICGVVLTDPIFKAIEESSAMFADITKANFNVTFEIAYAIAKSKPLLLFVNEGIVFDRPALNRIGIFDTIGYESYQNSDELAAGLVNVIHSRPLKTDYEPNRRAPIYMIEMPRQSEAMTHIVARTKKTRLKYRSFNLKEHVRLSANDAIAHVASSYGVIVPLAPDNMPDAESHNIRAAFIFGLAVGFGKPALILQDLAGPFPMDARDLISIYRSPADIERFINDFSLDVVEAMQGQQSLNLVKPDLLSRLRLGDPVAESEFETLGLYYVQGDAYLRALRGEVNLVVGRKGTGKTALFSQLRNAKRADKANVVVDLKPEGYQLVRLKEELLSFITRGAQEHLITIFWEYVLYLEICYKLLEKDKDRQRFDHTIRDVYQRLSVAYASNDDLLEGDFSERLLKLSERVIQNFRQRAGSDKEGAEVRLSSGEVSNLVYAHDIRALRDLISNYLVNKKTTWVLFDNLDKGWPAHGLQTIDGIILRCLIDASRKIQREMTRQEIDFVSVVFVRNDVYELLMQNSADFGKEMRVSLDWSDAEMLREMVKRRIVASERLKEGVEFEALWAQMCVSHVKGEDSFFYLIDRCLMRPRNILKLVMHCKGVAVNLGHKKIGADDVGKGLLLYSNDVLIEADQELADIDPKAENLMYRFIGLPPRLSLIEVWEILEKHAVPTTKWDQIIDYLLYYGFFGIVVDGDPEVIYDVSYNMKILKSKFEAAGDGVVLYMSPAFWPALSTREAA
ncbi:MAG: hypothetical protein K8F92_18535 [Hyphomicrobium sp.]|uniref:P-loop ATPase, Sll1717 family n=1 Tax=Hyphomicrobium sp. TaxID=82 RepID=UPI00132137F0|nr:hypothetical protein [Hyphomicrobium sp.]KAB2941926.1 MAG: hypothetical protein F9K20_07520 [Hyphomicrobium sp.]MBZ0211627.1 hypothetical protein [Hyphomicrobium sp.]